MAVPLEHIFGELAAGGNFVIREPRPDVVFDPDKSGYWAHPDFRWSLVPADAGVDQYFEDAGYELTSIERDLPIGQMTLGCAGWSPEPLGDGWLMVLVVDTDDGPRALFARHKK